MFKRFLACLIIACLCLSLLPAAYAAGDGEWDFDAATGTLHLKGTGTMDELFAVRSSFGFLKTVSMPWRDTENLRRVEIGEGITTVSDFAFEGCTKLEEVTLPEGLTHIGSLAFNGCSGLRRIVLPASLEAVDSFAFYGCSSLREVVYSGTAAQWSAVSVDVYNEPLTDALPKLGAPVANIPVFDPQRPPVPSIEVPVITPPVIVIPSIPPIAPPVEVPAVEAPPVERPAGTPSLSGSCGASVHWDFYPSGLLYLSGTGPMTDYSYGDPRPWDDVADKITALVIERGVTAVGRHAFGELENLESIRLPEGLFELRYNAFYSCTSLEAVEIPASVTSINIGVFEGCSALRTITVASGNRNYTAIDNVLFTADRGTLLLFPKAFAGEYTVPAGVKVIGPDAFSDCNELVSVTLPEGLTVISADGFHFCRKLERIVFPSTLEVIEGFAFSGCRELRELNFSEGLKSLDTWSFYSCDALTRITLPASLEHVADGTFCSCDNLVEINVARGNPYLRSVDGLLYSADYKTLYAIPAGRVGAVTVVEGVTFIYEDAANGCSGLTSITLPRTLAEIDDSAFSGCSSLETVRFSGTQSQWNNVTVGSANGDLLDARFEFLG